MASEFWQFGGSVLAIAAMIALVAWLRLGRDLKPLDEDEARSIADHAMPGFERAETLLLDEGRAALIRSSNGRLAYVGPHGARYWARLVEGSRRLEAGSPDFSLELQGGAASARVTIPRKAEAWAKHLERL